MVEFNNKIQEQFTKMCDTGKLFRADVSGQELWDLYLQSFEADPVFRDPASTVHNCNYCNNFIRRYGNIVAIEDITLKVLTIFDIVIEGEFASVAAALSTKIKNANIKDIFIESSEELRSLKYEAINSSQVFYRLGVAVNHKRYTKEEAEKYGVVKPNEIRTFNHMHLELPKKFVIPSSVDTHMAQYRDAKNVFQRAMETISLDTLHLVRDLINQDSLLDGASHLAKIEKIIPIKEYYDKYVAPADRDNFCWNVSYNLPYAKFRNELIGVLCVELTEGEDINVACQTWNKRVDPANYMKVKSPITAKQIEEAKKFVEENGYTESFSRRFATIDDIKASEIKHINVGDGKLKSVSIFDNVKSTSTQHKRAKFDDVEEITIDKFMEDVLPTATNIEAFFSNKHIGNLVSLTTANNPNSKPIFKWDNNYSWTFNGNLAGKSQIKEAVKSQGGKVDGVLRFSIMWADNEIDNSDLDAHCVEPHGEAINFRHKRSFRTGGNLDIDITQPQNHKLSSGKEVVENITFPALDRMTNGDYSFYVHQYAARNSQGFKAEIEFDGTIYSYEYKKPVSGTVGVAVMSFHNGVFTIKHGLPEQSSSKLVYGIETENFHKVKLVSLSPNHWGANSVGNKHYMFMLDGCVADLAIRSFHNENLISDLLQHRKVMDVLGNTNLLQKTDKQLSGLGFNATVRDELVVKVSGSFRRMLKIKF